MKDQFPDFDFRVEHQNDFDKVRIWAFPHFPIRVGFGYTLNKNPYVDNQWTFHSNISHHWLAVHFMSDFYKNIPDDNWRICAVGWLLYLKTKADLALVKLRYF